MKSKIIIPLFAFVTLLIMLVYFIGNPSYEKSIKAKYYYETGDYKEAYALAKEAFGLNVYNRMAATVMAQSKTSLRYVKYNEMAQKYMDDISEIAQHDDISKADKAKIRLICEVMIGSYIKLAPSVITDKDLVAKTASYHKQFEKLLEKVNKHK